jgi:hypothetical protein
MASTDGVRRLLAAARGYLVVGPDGKKVGVFIESDDEERIAIRRDGVLLWHRELVPLARVAEVDPDRRLIVVNGDSHATAEDDTPEPPPIEPDWRGRIESYVSPGENGPDRHLRFISTPSGYTLTEEQGRPPSPGSTVVVSEQLGPFLVLRLGPSPLPNDDRICAYLAPD